MGSLNEGGLSDNYCNDMVNANYNKFGSGELYTQGEVDPEPEKKILSLQDIEQSIANGLTSDTGWNMLQNMKLNPESKIRLCTRCVEQSLSETLEERGNDGIRTRPLD